MKIRLARYGALLHATPAPVAESLLRGLLIQYFFHVPNKAMIVIVGAADGASRTLNLLASTVFKGRGRVRLTTTTLLGWGTSPFSCRCSYIEAGNPGAVIEVGEPSTLNNAAVLIAEGAGLQSGARCLIGTEFQAGSALAPGLEAPPMSIVAGHLVRVVAQVPSADPLDSQPA